jgi:LacI family transcriptional regulator
MTPTIKDVAKKVGVSIATVSHVVNRTKNISPETTKKVLKAIKDLNYYPSRSAKGLASRKTGNIGFIITNNHFLNTEPFYTRVFLGVEFEARKNDYYVLLTTVDSEYKENSKLPRFIREKSVDGIIVAGRVSDKLLNELCTYHLPIVVLDYVPLATECPLVLIDNLKGGTLATQHLIDIGHENIAFISGEISHPSVFERLSGYKTALKNSEMKINDDFIVINDDELSRQNGYNSVAKLFDKRKDISAIFAGNDAIAFGIMQYLNEKKYKIPEDISLIGFDDIEADLFLEPTLSTIKVPKINLGIEALQLLVNTINNKNYTNKKIIVPVELIIRNSTRKNFIKN